MPPFSCPTVLQQLYKDIGMGVLFHSLFIICHPLHLEEMIFILVTYNLQYEHVSLAVALRCKVAHEPDEAGLTTASLSHYHYRNTTPMDSMVHT